MRAGNTDIETYLRCPKVRKRLPHVVLCPSPGSCMISSRDANPGRLDVCQQISFSNIDIDAQTDCIAWSSLEVGKTIHIADKIFILVRVWWDVW